jgi:hypothetical protein
VSTRAERAAVRVEGQLHAPAPAPAVPSQAPAGAATRCAWCALSLRSFLRIQLPCPEALEIRSSRGTAFRPLHAGEHLFVTPRNGNAGRRYAAPAEPEERGIELGGRPGRKTGADDATRDAILTHWRRAIS